MDIKNHNTDKKKLVNRKQFKAAVVIAVFLGIVLTVSRYFKFVSKTVYEESVSHLTEIFHQSDNMMRELTDKNLTYLHMWGENLQNTSNEDEIRDYIEKAQEDAGFLEFFFLSADGNYKKVTGETGYLGLQGNMEEELRQGSDVITNAAVPGKAQLLVFATPKAYGSYQGFEYDAIAIAYENSDIVNVLDISAFDGNAQSFVIHPDGRVVIDHSSESWGNVYNFFGVLREHSDMSEKEINELSEKFKEGRTDAKLVKFDGRSYYLVYEKSDIKDWMFLGLVPADIVNASMNSLQFNTMLLVGGVVLCIAALLISFIVQKGRTNIRKKDTEILTCRKFQTVTPPLVGRHAQGRPFYPDCNSRQRPTPAIPYRSLQHPDYLRSFRHIYSLPLTDNHHLVDYFIIVSPGFQQSIQNLFCRHFFQFQSHLFTDI